MGDVDGDMDFDAVIAAPMADDEYEDHGVVYVVYANDGVGQLWGQIVSVDSMTDVTAVVGFGLRRHLGAQAICGDIDADGNDEVFVTMDESFDPPSALASVIVLGQLSADRPIVYASSQPCFVTSGASSGGFGKALSIADANADGTLDLLISEPFAEVNGKFGAGFVHAFTRVTASGIGEGPVRPQKAILASYPNPFGSSASIRVPPSEQTYLDVYDVRGRLITSRVIPASSTERVITWPGTDNRGAILPSGVYFALLRGRDDLGSTRMLLIR